MVGGTKTPGWSSTRSRDNQYQPGFVGGPGRISSGGSGLSSSGFRITSPNGRSPTRRVSNCPVSAYARHHGTKNRLRSLVLLLTGGGEVVRGWRGEPIEAQPIEEFEVSVTKHVRRDWTIATGAIVQAARVVLSERICPPRGCVLNLVNRHPDNRGKWHELSLHGQVLSSKKDRNYVPFESERCCSISAAIVFGVGKVAARFTDRP